VTINETSDHGPALAPLAKTALVVAWKGTDNPSHLNVISTTDAISFGNKVTLPELSAHEPSMVGDETNAKIYLAWTGTDGHLNVAFTNSVAFANYSKLSQSTSTGNVSPLVETSDQAPAVAYDNATGRVFLAWKGNGNNQLDVMSSSNGSVFDSSTKVTIGTESTLTAPALVDVLGVLYLSWVGTNSALNLLVSTDNGHTFSQKTTLAEFSNFRPAVAGLGVMGSTKYDLHLVWAETNSLISINTAEDSKTTAFGYKQTIYNENSALPPAAARWLQQMYVGWTGTDGHLNVSRYSPGEVVGYGVK
jgi:hypothetical protein